MKKMEFHQTSVDEIHPVLRDILGVHCLPIQPPWGSRWILGEGLVRYVIHPYIGE